MHRVRKKKLDRKGSKNLHLVWFIVFLLALLPMLFLFFEGNNSITGATIGVQDNSSSGEDFGTLAASGNDDGFHTQITASATDVAVTMACTAEFEDFESDGDNTNIGSFDNANDTTTDRTPLQIRLTADNSLAGTGSCYITVHSTESCTSTALHQVAIHRNVNAPLVHEFNFTPSSFNGHIGELCINVTAVASDGLAGNVSDPQLGDIGVAPFLYNPTVSLDKINFFKTQTITHSLLANESADISQLRLVLLQASNNVTIGSSFTDTSTSTSIDNQIINLPNNPIPNQLFYYNYSAWQDDGEEHFRFSTNSQNATAAGFSPKTKPFNLTDVIQCNAFNKDDGFNVYNKGEKVNRSGTILDVNGNNWDVTTDVAFDIQYRNSTGNSVFTNTSFDISDGIWDRNQTIPKNASAFTNLIGEEYSMFFRVDNDADVGENNTCTYFSAFNVSDLIRLGNESSGTNNKYKPYFFVYNRGESVNITYYLTNVRGTPYENRAVNTTVLSASNSSEHELQQTTNGTGGITFTYTIASTDEAGNNLTGSPKFLNITPPDNNRFILSDNAHNVSSLLVSSCQQEFFFNVYNRNETTDFQCNIDYARGNDYININIDNVQVMNRNFVQEHSFGTAKTTNVNGNITIDWAISSDAQVTDDTLQYDYDINITDAGNNVTIHDVFDVSKTYFLSSTTEAHDDEINVNISPKVYNLGENVGANFTLFGIRNQTINNVADIRIEIMNHSNHTQNVLVQQSANNSGYVNFTAFLGKNNYSEATLTGADYHINISRRGNVVITQSDWNVSSLLRVGSTDSTIDNKTTTEFTVYNRGENTEINFSIFKARGAIYDKLSTVRVLASDNSVENEKSVEAVSSKYNFTYTIAETDVAENTLAGSQKRIDVNFSDGNINVTSTGSWNVSSLLITQCNDEFSFNTYNRNETTNFSCNLKFARGDDYASLALDNVQILNRDFNVEKSFTSKTTDASGNITIDWAISSDAQVTDDTEAKDYDINFTDSGNNVSSEDLFDVSKTYFVSTNPTPHDNAINVNISLFNLGENVGANFTLFGIRNQTINNVTDIRIEIMNSTNDTQNVLSSQSANNSGYVNFTAFLGKNNNSKATLLGEPYHINLSRRGNVVITNQDWNVSSLLRLGSNDASIDNKTTTPFTVFNRGQNVLVNFSLFKARGALYLKDIGVRVWSNTTDVEHETNIPSFSSATNRYNFTYQTASNDLAENNFAGSPKLLNVNFSDGNVNVTSDTSWNLSSKYLLNVHCEDDADRETVYSNVTFPDTNESFQDTKYIIAADVVFCWNEVRDAKNEAVNDVSTEIEFFRPDETSTLKENHTTGSDGWTTTFFDKSTEAPSGVWSVSGNVSHNNNTGNESDDVEFISPYTGNLVISSSMSAIEGNKKNTFSPNNVLQFIVHITETTNFVDELKDSDNNKTVISIYHADDGSSTCVNGANMVRSRKGIYTYDVSLNSTCGFLPEQDYQVHFDAKLNSRDVLGVNWFRVVEGSLSDSLIVGAAVSTEEDKVMVIGDSILIGARFIRDGIGSGVDVPIQYRVSRFQQSTNFLLSLNESSDTFVNIAGKDEEQFWYNLTKLTSFHPALDKFTYIRTINTENWTADNHFFSFRATQNGSTIYNTIQEPIINSTTTMDISVNPRPTAGENMEVKIFIYDERGLLSDATDMDINVYDSNGNKNLGPVDFDSQLSTGTYQFNFTLPSTPEGLWEIEINATRSGKTISQRRYFLSVGGPFDVRNIQVADKTVNDLSVNVDLENTGNVKQDMVVNWNLTRTDTGALLDSGQDTVAVAGGEVKTHTVTPNTDFVGQVKITFLGFYGIDFAEKAGAFETFTTESAAAEPAPAAPSTGGGGGGGGGAPPKEPAEEEEIPEIEIIPREGKIEIIGYPAGITLIKGEKMDQYLRVRNGGEGDLNNVILQLSGFPLNTYKITPKMHGSIPAQGVREFLIEFSEDLDKGVYDFKLLVGSDSGSSEIDGVLVIREPGEAAAVPELVIKEKRSPIETVAEFFKGLQLRTLLAITVVLLAFIVLLLTHFIRHHHTRYHGKKKKSDLGLDDIFGFRKESTSRKQKSSSRPDNTDSKVRKLRKLIRKE